jgi:hypothetical protein
LEDKIAAGELVVINGIIVDASAVSGDVVLPESMTEIPNSLFSQNKKITSVYIPAGVERVGQNAFAGCTSLTTVTFAEDSKLKTLEFAVFSNCTSIRSIGLPEGLEKIDGSFRGCSNLTSVIIPDSVEEIVGGSFDKCYNLTSITIPSGVTRLRGNVFRNTGITSITIPNTVVQVDDQAFADCPNLTEIIVADDHPNLTVVDGVLFCQNGLMKELVYYPVNKTDTSYVVPEGVQTLRGYAFANNAYLTEVTLPSTIMNIGNNLFANCSNLRTINYCDTQAKWNQLPFNYDWNLNVHPDFHINYDCTYPSKD